MTTRRIATTRFKSSLNLEALEDRTTPTVAYVVPAGSAGNQTFAGALGMDFDINQSVVVTRLGAFDSDGDGLQSPINVLLFNRDTQALVASVLNGSGTTGTLIDGSRFFDLAIPVTLPAGFHGTIVAEGYSIAEHNGNESFGGFPAVSTDSGGGAISFVGSGRFGNAGSFPTTAFGGSVNPFAAGTFDFTNAPNVFTVTNTNDSGTGSLRQAITDANNNPNSGGPDRIEFNIPGSGVHTIQPDFSLPDIQDPVVIDGYTQPGASPNTLAVGDNAVLLIEINGVDAGETSGLVIFAPDTTVRGLVVNGFQKGSSSTAGRGIAVLGPSATNVVIAGNFVGVNPAGSAAVPNENIGVFVLESPGVRVGGSDPADRNVISGNGIRGIFANAPNVVIQGNYIGTNAAGTNAVGNFFDGVFVAKNTGFQIGGSGPGEGNVIAANGFSGITLNGVNNSFVQGNLIGVGADGATPLGNGDTGLFISNQAATNIDNQIGGPSTAANTIAFNVKNGIMVQDPAATGNRFQRNSIFENGLLGIDLDNDGPTANDAGDADAGANGLQNKPVLTSAPIIAGAARVNGTINSVANETFVIELFSVPSADAPGGEGKTFIGATEVTTDASGNASFQVIVSAPEGTVISSTATRLSTKDTSEFSNDVTATTLQGGVVTGVVFRDVNSNGVRNAGEPGVGGVLVFLDANGDGKLDGEPATITAPDGSYQLASPIDGTFPVKARLPAGATQTGPAILVNLTAGASLSGVNVGVKFPPPPAAPAAGNRFASATGGVVQVFDTSRQLVLGTTPYVGFYGPVGVTLGDVNRDGVLDLITGTAAGSSHVKVFDGRTGALVQSFLAFPGFAGGVNVAAGDVTGDGYADVIVGTATGSSHVKVFDGASGALVQSFLAFPGFTGGVTVAAGDVDGNHTQDIVVGTATGASHVKAFRGSDLALLESFLAFGGFTGGVTVAAGDIDGDGIDNILVGTASGASHVKAFTGQTLVRSFLAFGGATGGVRVAAADRNGDGLADVIVGMGPGASPAVAIFRGLDLLPLDSFLASGGGIGGVFVGPT